MARMASRMPGGSVMGGQGRQAKDLVGSHGGMIAFDRRVRQEGNPVNAGAGGGWSVERDPGRDRARAVVAGPGTVASLAAKVGLGVGEWRAWLGVVDPGGGVALAGGSKAEWDQG